MLDYRFHYPIMVTEDRLRDAARGRRARKPAGKRGVHNADEHRSDRAARR